MKWKPSQSGQEEALKLYYVVAILVRFFGSCVSLLVAFCSDSVLRLFCMHLRSRRRGKCVCVCYVYERGIKGHELNQSVLFYMCHAYLVQLHACLCFACHAIPLIVSFRELYQFTIRANHLCFFQWNIQPLLPRMWYVSALSAVCTIPRHKSKRERRTNELFVRMHVSAQADKHQTHTILLLHDTCCSSDS